MNKITRKSWKSGTYCFSEYFCNGILITKITDHKKDCGIEYFNLLPDSEENAMIEDISDNLPNWLHYNFEKV
jgi:hypothetical protein